MVNRWALWGVKTLHTVIFLVESAAILYVLYCGLTRTYTVWLGVALAAVLLEIAVFVAAGRRCPLTKWARAFGDASGNDWIADIFLPAWFAPKIPLVCGGLFAAGVIVLALNAVLMALG